jgi:uncharacterized coiled-coil DUF342 family protein
MASRRIVKKKLNQMVNELVEEAYSVQLDNSALADKSDALINSIVEFHEEMLGRLYAAQSKKDLSGFTSEMEERGYNLFQDVMNLHV